MPVQTAIQVRRGTASSWTSTNPTLAAGEIGFETDTGKFKIGTGSTAWASLAYAAIDAGLLAAKGDLVTATANDTPAVLTVGSNGDTLVADSSTSTGLRYNPQNALANPVINGGFDIWQRGTSIVPTSSANTYTADRFYVYTASTGRTISRQVTNDTTNLPNIQYCARVQRDSGNTNTSSVTLYSAFETVNSLPYVGKTVTLSFYARAGANFSNASSQMSATLATGTGTDQTIGGYTGYAAQISQSATLTTTWQRFAYTATIPTTATEMGVFFSCTPSGTAGAADYFEITGIQIDLGTYTASTAPTFRRAGGNIAGELAACQRYYFRRSASVNAVAVFYDCFAYSTTAALATINFPQAMRAQPNEYTFGNLAVQDIGTAANTAFTASNVNQSNTTSAQILFTGMTGLTQYRPYGLVANNNTAAYFALSAEL